MALRVIWVPKKKKIIKDSEESSGIVCITCQKSALVKWALTRHCLAPDVTPVFSGISATRSSVLCVCFIERCLFFCPFSFGHCFVSPSSIYGFWLPLWYFQTILSVFQWCDGRKGWYFQKLWKFPLHEETKPTALKRDEQQVQALVDNLSQQMTDPFDFEPIQQTLWIFPRVCILQIRYMIYSPLFTKEVKCENKLSTVHSP